MRIKWIELQDKTCVGKQVYHVLYSGLHLHVWSVTILASIRQAKVKLGIHMLHGITRRGRFTCCHAWKGEYDGRKGGLCDVGCEPPHMRQSVKCKAHSHNCISVILKQSTMASVAIGGPWQYHCVWRNIKNSAILLWTSTTELKWSNSKKPTYVSMDRHTLICLFRKLQPQSAVHSSFSFPVSIRSFSPQIRRLNGRRTHITIVRQSPNCEICSTKSHFCYRQQLIEACSVTLIPFLTFLSRIWGSHGGEYADGCLLGCRAV
jgi:hypothetical protein